MAGPIFKDRVKETTTSTGTGTITLAGAVTGHQSFSAVGNGNTCYYCIEAVDNDGRLTGDWEVGLGTYTSSGTTLSRSSILASSNAGSVVTLGGGTKNVYLVAPADKFKVIGTIVLQEQQSSGTNAGTFTSGAWRTRVLNTELIDTNSDCSLSSNQFTLTAGTYEIEASAPAFNCDRHQARLYNATDATEILIGQNALSYVTVATMVTSAVVRGRFTIAAGKALELQHRCAVTSATFGFGVACSFGTEAYANIIIRRVE